MLRPTTRGVICPGCSTEIALSVPVQVVMVTEDGGDWINEMRQFIAHLDPDELDRLALRHAPTLNSKPGESYKAALLELVSG
jgi:hypothetical protein